LQKEFSEAEVFLVICRRFDKNINVGPKRIPDDVKF